MISIYQVFKLIFGLIVSAVMLFFLINYSGIYGSTQADINRALIMKNFMKAAQDVYMTGNPTNFTDFSRLEFDLTFRGMSDPPVIKSNTGFVPDTPVRIPLFFYPGRKIFIDRNHLDYGFWKFYFVEAVPEMTVIFTITGDQTDLAEVIVDYFPSTQYFEPKMKFGFCSNLFTGRDCGTAAVPDFCERYQFQASGYVYQSECTEDLSAKKYRLVKISDPCNSAEGGICIEPPLTDQHFIGYAYLSGSRYLYKDPVDLVALIIGGEEEDMFGTPLGETLYKYKNRVFRERLLLASKIFSRRAILLSPGSECASDYTNFASALNSIQGTLSESDYYTDPYLVRDLLDELDQAESHYDTLVGKGCEYII